MGRFVTGESPVNLQLTLRIIARLPRRAQSMNKKHHSEASSAEMIAPDSSSIPGSSPFAFCPSSATRARPVLCLPRIHFATQLRLPALARRRELIVHSSRTACSSCQASDCVHIREIAVQEIDFINDTDDCTSLIRTIQSLPLQQLQFCQRLKWRKMK